MCGFVGVYDRTGLNSYDIDRMLKLIQHRGPDEKSIKN